jgi:hypothetical protein
MAMPVMGYRVSMSVFGGKADIINCGTSGSRLLAMKIALVTIIVSLVSTPIWAAEFYIVHDRSTQKCTVVDKPLATNIRTITLATDAIYKTRRESHQSVLSSEIKRGHRNESGGDPANRLRPRGSPVGGH